MNKNIILDTSYWIALFDETDEYHETAMDLFGSFEFYNVIVPWPTMIELLRERFLKDKVSLEKLKEIFSKPRINFVEDKPYRDEALENTFSSTLDRNWKVSFTDGIIKLMITDVSLKIDIVASSNNRDFDEVVKRRNIQYYYK